MKRITWTMAIASLLLSGVALASTGMPATHSQVGESNLAPQPIDSFHFFGRFDSWRAVDRDTLIVWTTAFKPYLIELGRPSPRLRFAQVVGITSTVGEVHSRLDSVYVDGWPYQIKAIYRLTREQARNWQRT